jgi:hypothetical protein
MALAPRRCTVLKRVLAVLLVASVLFGVTGTAFARGGHHDGGRYSYYRHGGGHRGGFSWGDAAQFALMNAVIGTAFDVARGGFSSHVYQPQSAAAMQYYAPSAPRCTTSFQDEPLFDARGQYKTSHRITVTVCE